MTYEEFKVQANSIFRSAKHPDEVLKNTTFVDQFAYWYNILTNDTLKIYGCGVCLYETYVQIVNHTETTVQNRKAMKYIIKENEVVYFASNHYSRKSPNLTDELMSEIAKSHPDLVELNPNYEGIKATKTVQIETGEISTPEVPEIADTASEPQQVAKPQQAKQVTHNYSGNKKRR